MTFVAALLVGVAAFAQDASAVWKVSALPVSDGLYRLTFTSRIAQGMHIYGTDNPDNPFSVEYTSLDGAVLEGDLTSALEATVFKGEPVYFDRASFTQDVRTEGSHISGVIHWQACQDDACGFPEEQEFSVTAGAPAAAAQGHETAIEDPEKASSGNGGSIWALLLEAILWGLAMLLTPCVFPMVPMTVSFFLKASDNVHQGRFKAFMYGLFIVLLYTIPVVIIFGLTRLIGGESVTADIFNWLATHWLPNILFFLVFFVFALSFFGAFEITLPSSWSTKTDAKSGKGGLAGVFFMALTLVLVSFSCTGPIVGSVLLKSSQGEFWTPMVTMLAFSVAFALPFTIFALFPQLLKKLKSGSWLNSVKVVLGFVELALGLKFLSTADQTYHWGILDREVYLAIWIVVFTLLGLYLLGKIRFKYDSPTEHVSVLRLLLAIGVFSFVVYLVPGMWGAPLKGLSGYLPPMSTQDFIVYSQGDAPLTAASSPAGNGTVTVAHGLQSYETLEEGLQASREQGKPVFVDITGLGCVNCREMEARVWSDPEVLRRLRDNFVMVTLNTDDHSRLPESRWFTTPAGKVLKEVGSVNAYTARTRFNVNAQPNYIILDADGNILAGPRAYNLSIPGYIEFLDSAL